MIIWIWSNWQLELLCGFRARGIWEYYLDPSNRQLGILFGFSSNRQLAVEYFIWISGKLSGFQATGNWESYPDFNAISSRAFSLDFGQSAVKELYPKMYQKRITKKVSKNRCFPLKAILGLQNPSKTRSQTLSKSNTNRLSS